MAFIRIVPSWQLPENQITPESVFLNRRRFMKSLIGARRTNLSLSLCRSLGDDSSVVRVSNEQINGGG